MDRVTEQHVAVDAFHVDARGGAGVGERLGVQGPAAWAGGSRWRLDAGRSLIDGALGAFGFRQSSLLAVEPLSSHASAVGRLGYAD